MNPLLAPAAFTAAWFTVTSLCTAASDVDLEWSPKATHAVRLTEDTVVLATGRTCSFTVDSPEDQAPVSTAPTVREVALQFQSKTGATRQFRVLDAAGTEKTGGTIAAGDQLEVTSGQLRKTYRLELEPRALSGRLELVPSEITAQTTRDLTLFFTAGQRTPMAAVRILIPAGIDVTLDNTTVNVIGRGDVTLRKLPGQSIGRTGSNFSYSKVGEVALAKNPDGSTVISFTGLDLRPANGPDLKLTISNVRLPKTGPLLFQSDYATTEPDRLSSSGAGPETATLNVVSTISDFARIRDSVLPRRGTPESFTTAQFQWTAHGAREPMRLEFSVDDGRTWTEAAADFDPNTNRITVRNLKRDTLHQFRLAAAHGLHQGLSNPAWFRTGTWDVKSFGVSGDGTADDTEAVNRAIETISGFGGGILRFSDGVYKVRTVHLRSHVHLQVDRGATLKAMKGGDAPEATWFSDRQYRSGLSPTATGPYRNPENWLTKQDVGHTFFRNSMFFAERQDDIKIIGNGRITGDGNLVTGDRVMNNAPDNRCDKMFTFKLCTNIEIGGFQRDDDLWYDPDTDEPFYIRKDGSRDFDTGNMLHIDRGGHFVLLATGTDGLSVHNTYFAKHDGGNARDIYDFMGCNDVSVVNIYSRVSSDDIVKLGSDCSLGFTRPARRYRIRNIIGDTNCNLFQIGSETADDITDVHVDNIHVLGSNKAGFSISTNDGATIRDVHLNCGHTGRIHSRSRMHRTRAPFFISISNRGRVLGADVKRYVFLENGTERDELLCRNVNIGVVENIILNSIDVTEVYGGSSYGNRTQRWKAFDGSQNRATPIVAGYALPSNDSVKGGLDFTLPNGKHSGHIRNIVFNDVHVTVKGGNPASDRTQSPPELGVGQYNVSNLRVQPSYGLWARHVTGLTVTHSSFRYERRDHRYAIFLDDVLGARLAGVKTVRARGSSDVIGMRNSTDVQVTDSLVYDDTWGNAPAPLLVPPQTPAPAPGAPSDRGRVDAKGSKEGA